jgi:hypothetical protein
MTVLATETLTAEQIVKTAREQMDAFNAFKESHHQYFDSIDSPNKQIGTQPK